MHQDTSWIETEDDLREYIEQGDDNNTTDPHELKRLFELAYDRKPTIEDQETGLWSLICAGIPHK